MSEYSEREQQEMIDRARAGDPEANYRLSMWALEQSAAEPEEERWNRLAAKCLVKAAEAGYGPAKEKMNELLAQTAYAEPPEPTPEPASFPAAAPAPAAREYATGSGRTDPPRAAEPARARTAASERPSRSVSASPDRTGAVKGGALAVLSAVGGFFAVLGRKLRSFLARILRKGGPLDVDRWSKAKWKRVQIICIAICVVLALLIVLLIAGGRNKKAGETEVLPTPEVEVAVTPVPTPTPDPTYPDQATRAAIAAAPLDAYPTEQEYVTEPRTVQVATNGGTLNLRKGTSADTEWLASMPYHTSLPVYAYHGGWALVNYDGTYGWASVDYLTQVGE